jgi:hypothetical protein
LVPGIGIVVDAYILVRSFLVEQWSQGWAGLPQRADAPMTSAERLERRDLSEG